MRGAQVDIGPHRVAELGAPVRAVHADVPQLQPPHPAHRVRPEQALQLAGT